MILLAASLSCNYASSALPTEAPTVPRVSWLHRLHGPLSVTTLLVDPRDPLKVYAGTSEDYFFRSPDGGKTWWLFKDGLTDPHVLSLAVDPTEPNTIYAGTWQGVFKSTNGGESWSAFGPVSNTDINLNIDSLAVDPATGTIYAGTRNGLIRSAKDNPTWRQEYLLWNQDVRVLVFDPSVPGTLYAGTVENGSSEKTSPGLAKFSGSNYCCELTPEPAAVSVFAIDPVTPTTFYASLNIGLSKSTDSGQTWTELKLGKIYVRALAVDPAKPSTMYVALLDPDTQAGRGVWVTTDGGEHWSPINDDLTNLDVLSLAISSVNGQTTLYAGTDGSGVFTLQPAP